MDPIDRSNCPIARAGDILGDRWSLLILREFFLEGPRRYTELQQVLGLSPNTLSSRLKRLEAQGVLSRSLYSDHPPRAEYRLTDKGRSLGPVMTALYDWGRAQQDRRDESPR